MTFIKQLLVMIALVLLATPARADSGFPFGLEMKLDATPQPGSKRIPTLEIGDSGESKIDLFCKSGTGQFSVANDTVVFVPGVMEPRGCTPAAAQADDDLLAALSDAATWKRQGDSVLFIGAKTLRFRINTN
jgi:heat shock protein HslJ